VCSPSGWSWGNFVIRTVRWHQHYIHNGDLITASWKPLAPPLYFLSQIKPNVPLTSLQCTHHKSILSSLTLINNWMVQRLSLKINTLSPSIAMSRRLWKSKFHYPVRKIPSLVPTLNTPNTFKIHFYKTHSISLPPKPVQPNPQLGGSILPAETFAMKKRLLTLFPGKAEIERRNGFENSTAAHLWRHTLRNWFISYKKYIKNSDTVAMLWIVESNPVITSWNKLNILCRYKRVLL
jgi:hypothetical protein